MGKPPLLPEPLAIISYHLPQFHYLWTSLFGINKGLNQTEKISVKSPFHKPPVSISFPRKVIFFSPRWMGIHQSWECLIALALTLRYGTDCFFLHCGKVKTACDLWRKEKRGRHLCSLCDYYLSFFLDTLHLEHGSSVGVEVVECSSGCNMCGCGSAVGACIKVDGECVTILR